jgi:hypothetical protein
MKGHNRVATHGRLAERLRKLGAGPRICLFCGLADPLLLIAKPFHWLEGRASRSMLELHHVLGKNHDKNLTVLLCVLCHFLVTEGYLQAGIELHREPDPQKRVKHMSRAEATFLRQLADRNCQWAAILTNERVSHMFRHHAVVLRQLADADCEGAALLCTCETCDGE